MYDPTATVLAIACPAAQSILLYDVRNYDKVPFATFEMREIEEMFAKRPPVGGSKQTPGNWTKLEFSNDGKRLLVATTGPGHYLLDAFEGSLEAYCARPQGPTGRVPPSELGALRARQQRGSSPHDSHGVSGQGDACLSPDGRYVIGGSGENGLYVWDAVEGEFDRSSGGPEEKILKPSVELGGGKGPGGAASIVGYNPRHNLLCTADSALVFWLPEME